MSKARTPDLIEDKAKKISGRLSWDMDLMDPMIVRVLYTEDGREFEVMRLFLGEAIDCAGRGPIMEHLREIEESPWLTNWHKQEETV
jgi:hypothetical protein